VVPDKIMIGFKPTMHGFEQITIGMVSHIVGFRPISFNKIDVEP
jgi:hypothetical protein